MCPVLALLATKRRIPLGLSEQQRAEFYEHAGAIRRESIGFRRQVLKAVLASHKAAPDAVMGRWIDRERVRGTKIRNGTRAIEY